MSAAAAPLLGRLTLVALAAVLIAGCGASSAQAAPTTVTPVPARAAIYRTPPAGLRPALVQWRIPFPLRRRREMAAYSYRHYGFASYRLVRPRLIVEHYAVAGSTAAIFNTFAPDHPDPELHELPNTCAHFVIARDGTIFQLVPLYLRCRHVVGLNHVAIGIEHVGFTDAEVLRNPRQLAASLRLTRWLRCLYGITVPNVIGHAESVSSPFHLERIAKLRRATHGDFGRVSMTGYRARVARLGC